MPKWICLVQGREVGPITSEELRQLAEAGEVSPRDKVRKEGSDSWHEAHKVKGLFAEQVLRQFDAVDSVEAKQKADRRETAERSERDLQINAYIRSVLLGGENVLQVAKINPLVFLPPVLYLIAGVLGCIVSFQLSWGILGYVVIGGLFAYLGIRTAISAIVAYLTSDLVLTNRRLLGRSGFLNRTTLDLLLSKVEGVRVDQSLLGRIFNYGTIAIQGTGGGGTKFEGIIAPEVFRKSINEQLAKQ